MAGAPERGRSGRLLQWQVWCGWNLVRVGWLDPGIEKARIGFPPGHHNARFLLF